MEKRRLALVALVSTVLHVLAAFGSLFLLQPGTPIEPDADARAAYLADHAAAWRLGWAIWCLAAISLLALILAIAPREPLLWPPFAVAAAGFGADILSQSVLVFLLPDAPAMHRASIETWGYTGEGVFANGLYTLALALAVVGAYRERILPRWIALGCAPVCIAGAAVTLASFPMRPGVLFFATGALTLTMLAWTTALGVWAWRASS